MVAVRMMEIALNQIIDVVTVGHSLVSATGTVVVNRVRGRRKRARAYNVQDSAR